MTDRDIANSVTRGMGVTRVTPPYKGVHTSRPQIGPLVTNLLPVWLPLNGLCRARGCTVIHDGQRAPSMRSERERASQAAPRRQNAPAEPAR